ncbi:MAG TPA: SBBP repeat-containing protein, partial [Bacteroidia bacterium]|nr:SBBP repeat-containing protein [Bacteroidia bacterium]
MKKIILSVSYLAIAIIANSQSPSFEWAKSIGGPTGSAEGNSVTVNSAQYVYTTGSFQGKADFDPGSATFYLNSSGSDDVFVSKFNSGGTIMWAKQMGGAASDVGKSIAVDGSGNVYTTGYFSGTADFDPGAGVFNLTSFGGNDIFISKLDLSGNFVWAKQLGGIGDDVGNSIAVDGAGNVYTTGNFNLTADFDPGAGTFNLSSAGGIDIFITELNASGNLVWAKRLGETTTDYGNSLAIDALSNVYITGLFSNTLDCDPGAGTFNLTAVGSSDIFIDKLDASGNFVWAKQLGGINADYGNSIAVDGPGNIYTTGFFHGTGDFDPGAGTFNLISAGNADIFISKLDGSGNFVWAKQFGGTAYDYAYSIKVDGAGNVYTTGRFQGTSDFDPGAAVSNLVASGDWDVFISKLNTSGNYIWAKSLGGQGFESGNSIAVDGGGYVITTGSFSGLTDFDPGPAVYNVSYSPNNFWEFISKLDASGNFLWAKSGGSSSSPYAKSVTTDGSGNVYTTGYFYGIVDFDPGAGVFTLTNATYGNIGDIFISKLDASGNFAWAIRLGGIGHDEASSLVTDASGNIFVTGYFNDTVDFDPGPGIYNLTTVNSKDAFILKLDASGNFIWAKQIGGPTSVVKGISIVSDGSGNVYTTGTFYNGITDFDPGSGTFYLTPSSTSTFISKLDASGNFAWAKMATSSVEASAIALDPTGYVYTTGYFSGTVDFNPGAGTFNLASSNSADVFVLKLDVSGNFVYAKQMGGNSFCTGTSVMIDASGNVLTTGYFADTADFDPGAATFNLTSAGSNDVFISKLDASGNFVWAKQIGGTSPDFGNSIALDGSGNVYITGIFLGTVDFDPAAAIFNLTASGSNDVFISRLDAAGNFVWAKQLGGTASEHGKSIAVDAAGSVYTTGYFYGTGDYDPGAGTFYLYYPDALYNPYIFVQKMSQCTLPSALITPAGSTTFCSGGSVVLNAPTGANKSYQWKKGANIIPGATLSSYTATAGGNYRVIVTNTVTGCSKTTTSPTTVTVNPVPPATITPQGPTTFCAGGSVLLKGNYGAGFTYQWKKGGNDISGATAKDYTATIAGTYKIKVTNSYGCAKLSTGVTVTVPCRENESVKTGDGESAFDVKVFPNPSSGDFVFEISNVANEKISINIYDNIGKIVLSETVSTSEFTI